MRLLPCGRLLILYFDIYICRPCSVTGVSLIRTPLHVYAYISLYETGKVVVGGCHSLMNVDGVLHGDPLEASALEGIQWAWNATSHTAYPKSQVGSFNETTLLKTTDEDTTSDKVVPKRRRSKKKPQEKMDKIEENSEEKPSGPAGKATGEDAVSVAVWRRYAFSSHLQRMSVVAEVDGDELTALPGVPEVIRFLCYPVIVVGGATRCSIILPDYPVSVRDIPRCCFVIFCLSIRTKIKLALFSEGENTER